MIINLHNTLHSESPIIIILGNKVQIENKKKKEYWSDL
jgi:hypothetical protein